MNYYGSVMPIRSIQNPNSYAVNYANKNDVSFQTATTQLRNQFGNPMNGMQNCSIFMSNPMQEQAGISIEDIDLSQNVPGDLNNKNFFERIANFFRGGEGPQNQGDPQPHLSAGNSNMVSGPQNEGDPQPHLANQQKGQQNPFGGGSNPDEYAQQYAAQNNLTLEQARAQLQQMYGDPTKA